MKAFLFAVLGMLMTVSTIAQTGQINVRGTVKDTKGEAVIGANILLQGTSTGTVTDIDGNFTLQAPSNGVLEVSYIGYKPLTVPINNQANLQIVLHEDTELLDEVVVIGYGTVRKNDATGSVTAIKPEQMNKGLTVNAQDMITGKIAGVVVTPNGGAPGEGATIRIRGGSSLNASNDPLIVIDGLAIDNNGIQGVSNFLSTINPNDIESFTVLKDASATAIYGSRASNGVILIQTKKGMAGMKPTLSYNGNFNISTPRNYVDVMNGDEYRDYVNKLYAGDAEIIGKLGPENTNWQKQIYRTAVGTDHNVNVAGGFKNIPYRASVGYTGQQGIIKTSSFNRFTGALSLNPSLLDDALKINFNLKGMYVKNRFADTGAVGNAVRFDPTHPVMSAEEPFASQTEGYYQWATYNDDGTFKSLNSDAPHNPLGLLEQKDDRSKAWDVMGNIDLDYKLPFMPDLKAHLTLATDISHGRQNTWISPASSTNFIGGGYDGYTIQDKWNRQLSTYLQYTKNLTNQNIDLMAGYEWQRFHREGSYYGQSITKPDYIYQADVINWATHNQLVSFFGRANYSLLDRYMFTATVRADGSSRFSPENRWSIFPSFAFAWRLKNEAFLADNNTISDMKFRLGYGVTGQQDIGSDFPYLPVYTINKDAAFYPFGDTYYSTARPDAYNPNLKWEETTTYNVGFDISLLNNRFSAALDYYYRVTNDLINMTPIPAGTNFRNKVFQNIGSLNNKGVELMLNARLIEKKDLSWEVGYNVTANRNRITKLTTGSQEGYYVPTGGIFQGSVQAHAVGYSANSFYVYQQVYDNAGKPIEGLYVDRNGDHKINENDKYFFHKSSPDLTMGLSSKVIYKQFDFGISTRANIGNYVYNAVAAERMNVGTNGIWSPLGFFENKVMSAFDTNFTGGSGITFMSDYYVQNASFLRVDNITLGYSFNKVGFISGGRLSATVQNPLVFTQYKGLDPEVFSGIDGNIYPKPVMVVFGVTLNF
ncbi:MAG: TonB-dependent receptor [Petrimonas sp.]|nr:TonB-dependent receptor [Petrimonas sp.]